jgi:ubiquinone/menaquinone biosynthesis C-methylase UbiE
MRKLEKENKLFFGIWSLVYGIDPVSLWLKSLQNSILSRLKISKESYVLDVGCANGGLLSTLYFKGVRKLYGVDISDSMIKRANKKLGNKAVLKAASVEKIPFNPNSFDYVLSTEAFHHFPDPDKAIKEMKRMLKKNGRLVIADINFYFNFIHWLFKKIEPGHVKIYNDKEFRNLFEKNNLKIIEQRRIGLFSILTIGKNN